MHSDRLDKATPTGNIAGEAIATHFHKTQRIPAALKVHFSFSVTGQ